MSQNYIKASELNTASFCRRAWFLERKRIPSTLIEERARGIADHEQHGAALNSAGKTRRFGVALIVIGILALLATTFFWGVFTP